MYVIMCMLFSEWGIEEDKPERDGPDSDEEDKRKRKNFIMRELKKRRKAASNVSGFYKQSYMLYCAMTIKDSIYLRRFFNVMSIYI